MPTPSTGSTLVPNSTLHSHKAPIDNLPYDVIREIFIHCVSTNPLRPPRAKLAPMLLTQICSSWRSIALESPTLWTHLYFCLTIAKSNIDGAEIIPKQQIELLRWWKGNHNSLMPHLSLETKFWRHEETQEYLQLEESLDFILAYIASAQYISMDRFYWIQIEKRINDGDEITFPHLHTLVTNPNLNYGWNPSFALVDRITKQCTSSLRYLSISTHYVPENTAIPSQWASLTHLSLREMQLSPARWFTFIRLFPKLQWGNFHIEAPFGPVDKIDTSRCTLPELADIFITFDDRDNDSFRISFIFANLYLPTLRTLSIHAHTESWRDIRSVSELRTILESTPTITTLILGPGFLNLQQPQLFHLMNDVEPIWYIATQLIHLQLEISIFKYGRKYSPKESLDIFMKKAFLSNTGWLPLKNPMCPIQRISLFGHGLLNNPPDYALASLSELSGEIPTIRFEFTSNSMRWNAEEAWKDWH